MRNRRDPASGALCITLALATTATSAHADTVVLASGQVVEGRAVRHADKVTIELEAGSITLSADAVTHIDKRESNVDRYERRYAQLAHDDTTARLTLANFCRDHDMRARERVLLHEVIERAPEHGEARARLGYVKGPNGWITQEEDYRARGMVRREGVWMTSERASLLDQQRAEVQAAQHERERALLALEAERLALHKEQLEIERENTQRANAATSYAAPYNGYYPAPFYGPARTRGCGQGEACGFRVAQPILRLPATVTPTVTPLVRRAPGTPRAVTGFVIPAVRDVHRRAR